MKKRISLILAICFLVLSFAGCSNTIKTEKTVPEKTKYVGIRAHEFEMIDEDRAKEEKNTLKCRVSNIVEDVFEYNIFLENKILYKVKKVEWDSIKDKENVYLKIPENSILFLENQK